jgi:hypothetical protein
MSLALYPQEKIPGTDWIGGWVGPRPTGTLWRRKQPLPLPKIESRFSGRRVYSVTLPLSYPISTELLFFYKFHSFPHSLEKKCHRSLFFFDIFYQRSNHVKHVTVLSQLKTKSCGRDSLPTFLWYDRDRIENDCSNVCIRCRGNVFTEPLPNNDRVCSGVGVGVGGIEKNTDNKMISKTFYFFKVFGLWR